MIKAIIVDYYGVLAQQVKGRWQLDLPLLNTLHKLKDDVKLGLLSNSYAKTLEELDPQLGEGFFDLVILGGATGLWKPDKIVYQAVIQHLKLDPAQILVVDDNVRHLEVAGKLGLATFHYENFDEFKEALNQELS